MKQAGLLAATVLLASTAIGAHAAPFSVTAYFTPSTVSVGQNTNFYWNSPTGSFCEVYGLPGGMRYGRTGNYAFAATASLNVQVSCERMDTFSGKSATLTVVNSSPTVVAKFNPSTVYVGGAGSTFSWTSTLASQCSSPQHPGVAGTSGSISFAPAGSPSQQSITVNCGNGNGSASHTATLTTMTAPPAPPTVNAWAMPDYLNGPGTTEVSYSATNATSCTGQGYFYVSYNRSFPVTCTGPGGSATAYAWVTVERDGNIPVSAPMSVSMKDGKRAVSKPAAVAANLTHLGIDLSKKRYAFTDGDLNSDGAADLIVLDKLKQQVHVLLNKGGQYPAIAKTVDQVDAISQIKGVFVPLSGNPGEIRVTVQSQQ